MDPNKSIAVLKRQKAAADDLVNKPGGPEFTKWERDTEVAIERIFGHSGRHASDFKSIGYSLGIFTVDAPQAAFDRARWAGLREASAVLQSMIEEIIEYEAVGTETLPAPDALNLVERICLRFHRVARQLQHRHGDRPTLRIEDEYDVQDLLHGLLNVHFDDIRSEEWTPSYAGSGSRVDFLLKAEGIVVEVKKTRASLKTAQLGEQLIVDMARYARHPDCRTLVCFVYDPEERIGNPVGIEQDLESHDGKLAVRVIVGPKQ